MCRHTSPGGCSTRSHSTPLELSRTTTARWSSCARQGWPHERPTHRRPTRPARRS
jgi:hypothetical protein